MKKAIVIILVIVLLAAIIYKISTHQKETAAQSISDIQRAEGVPVEVLLARKDTLVYSREFSGEVEGFSQASAIAHLMETVSEIRVKVGEAVSPGDVLVVLNKSNPQAQYQQARLAFDNAEKEFARVSALFDQGAVSRQIYDQAALARDIAQTNFSNARELVEITAPIGGIVTDVMIKAGQVVTPGEQVVTISAINRIKCELWVGDADRQRIKVGQTALFYGQGDPSSDNNSAISGVVDEIALSANQESHLYKVIARADNRTGSMHPGQLVSVRVITESIPDVLVIPRDAIIFQNDKPFVFHIENGLALLMPISIGRENRDRVEVSSGLAFGDTVVVYGMNRLKTGEKVKIVSSSREAGDVSE